MDVPFAPLHLVLMHAAGSQTVAARASDTRVPVQPAKSVRESSANTKRDIVASRKDHVEIHPRIVATRGGITIARECSVLPSRHDGQNAWLIFRNTCQVHFAKIFL